MTDDQRRLLLDVYAVLDTMHAWRGWHWWPDGEPFEVSVGAILVQNTSWTNVERALEQLRSADVLRPARMAALSQPVLEELVRPSGQYRQKARKLREFLALIARHGSLDGLLARPAEELRAALLATWGIGPETADAIVLYAACQPSFVIDAYTQRLFNRLSIGPVTTSAYRAWQRFFVDALPEDRDLWARYHALIVMHNKHLCLKNRPRCGECLLALRCPAASPAR
jgi:endonuclease-3 related protein